MGRFINCFTVVILKFKKATILDLIWSISPLRGPGRDSKSKIKSISSDTHQLHAITLHYFTIKIIIFDTLGRSEMLNKK